MSPGRYQGYSRIYSFHGKSCHLDATKAIHEYIVSTCHLYAHKAIHVCCLIMSPIRSQGYSCIHIGVSPLKIHMAIIITHRWSARSQPPNIWYIFSSLSYDKTLSFGIKTTKKLSHLFYHTKKEYDQHFTKRTTMPF